MKIEIMTANAINQKIEEAVKRNLNVIYRELDKLRRNNLKLEEEIKILRMGSRRKK